MKYQALFILGLFLLFSFSCTPSKNKNQSKNKDLVAVKQSAVKPNIIFFAVDDMNDFVNPLGYKQAITPNLDRLANMGVTFTNAHAPSSYCAPSRTAIWTGLQSTTTGCYRDELYNYDYPDLVPLHEAFKQAGYSTYGAGKLNHHKEGHVDLDGWDEFFARNENIRKEGFPTGYHGDDLPRPTTVPNSPYYTKTGRKKIIGGGFLEWGAIPNEDTDKMMGVQRTKWICDLLKQKHEKPFFMGLGLYTPHYPNYAPQKYFDLYDLDKIKLPEIPEDDLDDLPEDIRKKQINRSHYRKTLEETGTYKEAVRAYLAAVSYADDLLGDVLDALEASAYKDNTIVIFWSDQGYHLGEKGDWGKHTLWSETSRVPLFIAGSTIPKNKRVESTTGLIDLYPTLIELCNLPKQHKMDGKSLVPELMNDSYEDRDLFIPYHERGSYAIVNDNYRYIYYKSGGEEFYNTKEDHNEWNNLVSDENYNSIIDEMKNVVPNKFRKPATPKKSLNLIFEENGYHWESKNGGKPQMTL